MNYDELAIAEVSVQAFNSDDEPTYKGILSRVVYFENNPDIDEFTQITLENIRRRLPEAEFVAENLEAGFLNQPARLYVYDYEGTRKGLMTFSLSGENYMVVVSGDVEDKDGLTQFMFQFETWLSFLEE